MSNKPLLYLEDVAEQSFRTGRDSELFLDPHTYDLWKVSNHPKYQNPDLSMDEALLLEEEHRLLRLPKARDLNELEIMDEYIDYVPDHLQKHLLTTLNQPNPFQSYRARLEQNGLLFDYYQFRNERGAEILEEWCQDHEIAYRHQISLLDLAAGYEVKQLENRDAGQVLRLMQSNPQYFTQKPSLRFVKTEMVRLPQESMIDQKYYLGYYDQGKLIAILDLILDHPQPLYAYIRELMVDARKQNKGIGSQIVQALEEGVAKAGFAHIALEVEENDEDAIRFWEKLNYKPTQNKNGMIKFEKEQELPQEEYVPEFEEVHEWNF